jgi:hypothetical protein
VVTRVHFRHQNHQMSFTSWIIPWQSSFWSCLILSVNPRRYLKLSSELAQLLVPEGKILPFLHAVRPAYLLHHLEIFVNNLCKSSHHNLVNTFSTDFCTDCELWVFASPTPISFSEEIFCQFTCSIPTEDLVSLTFQRILWKTSLLIFVKARCNFFFLF